ncbi:MAG TPA: hypothetical protein VGG85_06015 [Terracidiphilus sp.]|jgi:hypothetical protein
MNNGRIKRNFDALPNNPNPGLKVGWAKHHLDLLTAQIRDYLRINPYSISVEDDLEAGEHIVKLDTIPPSVEIPLIAGDFVSCLRGSLDHLATALTLVEGGNPSDAASFPVIARNNSSGRKRFNEAVSGITPGAIKTIESLQPYHSGDAFESTKLWRLHRLWNIDKHRRIPFQPTITQLFILSPSNMPPLPGRPHDDGVLRFPLAAKGKLDLNPTVKITIQFGDASEGIIAPYEELIEIHDFIRDDLFPRFKGFFK